MGDPTQGPSGPEAGTTAPPATTGAGGLSGEETAQIALIVVGVMAVAFLLSLWVMRRIARRRAQQSEDPFWRPR